MSDEFISIELPKGCFIPVDAIDRDEIYVHLMQRRGSAPVPEVISEVVSMLIEMYGTWAPLKWADS